MKTHFIVLMLFLSAQGLAVESNDIVQRTMSRFCDTTSSHMVCINEKFAGKKECPTYVFKNTKKCSSVISALNEKTNPEDIFNITIKYNQCALEELLLLEGLEYEGYLKCVHQNDGNGSPRNLAKSTKFLNDCIATIGHLEGRSKAEPSVAGACIGFVTAIYNKILVESSGKLNNVICLPEKLPELKYIIQTVVSYLQNQPEEMDNSIEVLVATSFEKKFPCE